MRIASEANQRSRPLVWTATESRPFADSRLASARGVGVKTVSPAMRGRSEATRLDADEHALRITGVWRTATPGTDRRQLSGSGARMVTAAPQASADLVVRPSR